MARDIVVALLEAVLFVYPIVIVLVIVPLIFPTGRLLSPRWRIIPAFAEERSSRTRS